MKPIARKDEPAVLYAAPQSGYAYKVALMLSLVGVEHHVSLVDITVRRSQRPAAFRAIARFDEIPVLMIDGLAITQSNVICEYLARRESRLQEGDESQRLRTREWLAWEAERIGLNLAHACSAQRDTRYSEAIRDWYEGRVREDLSRLARELEHSAYLLGDQPTVADIACYAWLPYARSASLFLPELDALSPWMARIEALPGFVTPEQAFSAASKDASA